MTKATHKATRIVRTSLARPPLDPREAFRKDLLLGTLVGVSMLLITGLYAATFRYQKIFTEPKQDAPRWSALQNGFIERTQPVQMQFERLRNAAESVVSAKKSEAAATIVMKKKLEARATDPGVLAPATETPETP
jgi:hypothetical protein